MYLTANEGEAAAQLQQEVLDVIYQRLLDLALASRVGGAEEVEEVGVLEDLSGQVRLGGRQGIAEVGDGLALALVGVGVDLYGQDVARPAVLHHLADVPLPHGRVGYAIQQHAVVEPGDLCSEKPCMSENASRRSVASRSITRAPQPSRSCRSRIVRPMSQ